MTRLARMVIVLAGVLFGLCASQARASGGPAASPAMAPRNAPLTLPEVLDAVEASHPLLHAARRELEAAEGKRLSASGAFDPVLALRGETLPGGYYGYTRFEASIEQPTPLWGTQLRAGYRGGWGRIPVYKGELETLRGGELRAELQVPVWRDGPIDARRAGIRSAELMREAADCDVAALRLQLQQRAARAYLAWVAAGQQVRIAQELLTVAERRDAGLRRQASLGSIAPILVVDNERLVLDRRARLVEAQRTLREATLELSLFARDKAGRPREPRLDRLPELPAARARSLPDEPLDVAEALAARPEVCSLSRRRAAAGVDVELSDNRRAPELDLHAFVARDLGRGEARLQATEVGVGLRFELPLLQRQARGEQASARALAAALDAELAFLRDRIATEVAKARAGLALAREQATLAQRQVSVARELARAERVRLEQGASDLVVVNLRELSAADAQRLHVQALAAHARARVDYLTATARGIHDFDAD